MRLKKNVKRFLLLIIFVLFIGGGVLLWKRHFDKPKTKEEEPMIQEKDPIEQQDTPVVVDKKDEFNIVESHFIEANYDRYIAYKELHPDYTDDNIINYVNIGLDRDFYTNMEDTDMSDGILILCNKYHKLKKDYKPDLVSLSGYGGGQMQKEAASHFKEMVKAAKKDGITLWNVSGYRSYSTQKSLYNNYVKRDGVSKADTYSARAGTSEHQTGLATDINTASSKAHFEKTKEYAWLIKNAHQYGFILRYPEGKTFITGYKYEPWHYRYVGKEVAQIIYEKNITYEEYYVMYMIKD